MRGARLSLILLFTVALAGVTLASSIGPQVAQRSQRVNLRTQTTAGGATGYVDRATGAQVQQTVTTDTSVAFAFRVVPNMAIPDSLNNIIVLPIYDSAVDPGDTTYIALDGSNDNGRTWQILNRVNTTDTVNGFTAGGIAGLGSLRTPVYFNAKASSTTNVLGRSPVIIPPSVYTAWYGWTLLRVRLMHSPANVPSTYTLWVTYPSPAN